MKNNQDILSSILKTTQMGQIGIRSVLDTRLKPELRQAMVSQLKEYDTIETEAHHIASEKKWKLPELNPSIRMMTDQMTKLKLSFGNRESKVAAMMIRGNTSGIIKGLKNLHQVTSPDADIVHLGNRLIETETANVTQMREFL